MPLKVIVGTATKDAVRGSVFTNPTTAKRMARIEAWNGTAWKLVQSFAPPISLSITPDSVIAVRNAAAVVAVTTGSNTAVVAGGTGPYTYLWTQTSGPPASIYSPYSASSVFAMGLGPGSIENAQFTCTVTDANGLTAPAVLSVTFANNSGA